MSNIIKIGFILYISHCTGYNTCITKKIRNLEIYAYYNMHIHYVVHIYIIYMMYSISKVQYGAPYSTHDRFV